MHSAESILFDGEDSKDFSEQRIRVSLQVVDVVGQYLHEHGQLAFPHRLDNELLIVTEEEETATLASAFARLEHLLAVGLRTERRLQKLQRDVVLLKQLVEFVKSVESNFNTSFHFLHTSWALGHRPNPVVPKRRVRV